MGYFPIKNTIKLLELELESLIIPEANAAEEAGKLIMNLPRLWEKAN